METPSLVAIIDDDEDVRTSLEMLLQSIGHRTATFASADEFLATADPNEFQCLISDVQMSGTDGINLADRVARMSRVPIVLITAFPTDEIRLQVRATDVVALLSKPFDPNELIVILDEILGS